jgi:hypothetical protein
MTAWRRWMGARGLLLSATLATSCAGEDAGRVYENNDLQLLTAYAAKEACSCIFVMGQTEEFCRRWTRAAPDLKTLRINRTFSTVETQAVLFFSARARYTGKRHGCVLE